MWIVKTNNEEQKMEIFVKILNCCMYKNNRISVAWKIESNLYLQAGSDCYCVILIIKKKKKACMYSNSEVKTPLKGEVAGVSKYNKSSGGHLEVNIYPHHIQQ